MDLEEKVLVKVREEELPSKTHTKEYVVPKCYCPKCKENNFASVERTTWKNPDGRKLELVMWSCTKCDTVLNFDKKPEIKEWYSQQELIDMGYAKMSKEESTKHLNEKYGKSAQ